MSVSVSGNVVDEPPAPDTAGDMFGGQTPKAGSCMAGVDRCPCTFGAASDYRYAKRALTVGGSEV